MMHGDRSRDPPTYPPGWGGLARKLVLEENTIEGAVAALNEMVAGGIDVRLCSSPLSSSPCCVMEKVEWAVAHLGASPGSTASSSLETRPWFAATFCWTMRHWPRAAV